MEAVDFGEMRLVDEGVDALKLKSKEREGSNSVPDASGEQRVNDSMSKSIPSSDSVPVPPSDGGGEGNAVNVCCLVVVVGVVGVGVVVVVFGKKGSVGATVGADIEGG